MSFKKLAIIILIPLLLLINACGSVVNSTMISSAGLYLDPEGLQPTEKFDARAIFYCKVTLEGSGPDTTLQASWVAVETNRAEPNTVIKIEEIKPSDSTVLFKLQNESHFWPTGVYELYLYLDGNLDRVIQFEVAHDYSAE